MGFSLSNVIWYDCVFTWIKYFDLTWLDLFIYDRCRRSSAAGTPVKYECDSRNLTCIFARSIILLTEKLTNRALVTPTPVRRMLGFQPSTRSKMLTHLANIRSFTALIECRWMTFYQCMLSSGTNKVAYITKWTLGKSIWLSWKNKILIRKKIDLLNFTDDQPEFKIQGQCHG